MSSVFHLIFLIHNQLQLFVAFICINFNHGQIQQDTKLTISIKNYHSGILVDVNNDIIHYLPRENFNSLIQKLKIRKLKTN